MCSFVVTIILAGVAQTPGGEPFAAKDGLFTVAAPEGFAWSLVKEDEVEGVPIRAYLCAREGSPTRIVLTVEGRVHADDAARAAAVKGHWNGMLEMLQKAGYQKPRMQRPSVDPPLADRVAYGLSADDPAGARRYVRCVTVFGSKSTYLMQAMAGSAEEADALMPTLDSFRELP